jgi:hypothetical protein
MMTSAVVTSAVVTPAMASAVASAVVTTTCPYHRTRSQPQPEENEAYQSNFHISSSAVSARVHQVSINASSSH